jgi:carbamoyl-phosphate synthase large subunit
MRIAVTGVGGGVGQSIVKALQDSPYAVVGIDSEELAAGLHAVPSAYRGRYASDPRFVDRLLEICSAEQCSLLFPGHDVELLGLAQSAERFKAIGTVPVVSTERVLQICDDKLETSRFLAAAGFPAPESQPLRDYGSFEGPVILKPQRGGARSRSTYLVRSAEELAVYRELVDVENCVVQEFIEGDEYTCGSVVLDGKCAGVIVMRRTLRAGDTYKARVERHPGIEATVSAIVERLQPFGGCNVQLRVRCSGTTAARALAGFNEPRMVADFLLSGSAPSHAIRELTILRYWKELVVANERIDELRDTEHLSGDGTRL